MNSSKFDTDPFISSNDRSCDHLENCHIPPISLPNQDGNLLKLNRQDTFRIILYCYPMTGRPDKPLPKNWNQIPGASGCTLENSSFRDNYDEIITLNAVPVGLTTQSVEDIKEMTTRLKIKSDILSDANLNFIKKLQLPTFEVENLIFVKRLTLIIERSVIKNFFYPIFSADKHINDVIKWLKVN